MAIRKLTHKLLILIGLAFLTGCSGKLLLIDKSNKQDIVTYNTLNKSMEVIHNGVLYKGNYVTDSRVGYGNVQTFGNKPSYGTSQVFIAGKNGRSILFGTNGDKLSCEFTYSDLTAIGVCSNNAGEKFDLVSKNIFLE
jgi:hypothetical protein